jgi:hypothetical protein
MVDTKRTLVELIAQAVDNTAGGYTNQDIRDFMVSVFGDYEHWDPDAPPETPHADDEEWWAQEEANGLTTGWSEYDPGSRLTTAIAGPGLHLISASLNPAAADNASILAATALLDAHSYTVFANQPDVPRTVRVFLVSDTDESLDLHAMDQRVTITITGLDANGSVMADTFEGPYSVGAPAIESTKAFAVVSSIATSTGDYLTGDEQFSVGYGVTVLPQLAGIYRDVQSGDGTWSWKLCGGASLSSSPFVGLAFFEDATDPSKRIFAFGEHWFGDVEVAAYDSWVGPSAIDENEDAVSGYQRVRRNGTAYTMDFSAQGLSFATDHSLCVDLDIGFVPQHVGFILDNSGPVDMGVVIAYLRYKAEDIGLTGIHEGRRALGREVR